MDRISLSVPLLIKTVDNHETLKEKILKDIESMGTTSLINPLTDTRISNTDWHMKADYPRPYINTIRCLLEEVVYDLKRELVMDETDQIGVNECWFQQYTKGDNHRFHYHLGAFYNCVYYVELPEDGPKTTIRIGGVHIDVPVKEGQILCFPGTLEHCSKPNESEGRKTVIAFNTVIPTQ